MTRQEALNITWRRLFIVLCAALIIGMGLLYVGGSSRVVQIAFLIGNIGGYVSVHRSLGELADHEVIDLSSSWWPIIGPSLVGGVLAVALYLLFLSNILGGDLFPKFDPDENAPIGIESLLAQHGRNMADYGKLFFWSFVAGFNQKYVVDIINSVKAR
jgi:hypothetical protein